MASREDAPAHPFPQVHYYSIEYPGYVQPASVSTAIRNLGGQARIDNVFRRNTPRAEVLLELSLRPDSMFSHPIPGDVVGTHNLLLKVIKRRKMSRPGQNQTPSVGEYKADVIGVVAKTVRFRSMVDFQYEPDSSDPISQLRKSMHEMDVDAIRQFTISPEANGQAPKSPSLSNVHSSLLAPPQNSLRLFPPPVFSRQAIPQAYNFRANTASVVTTVVDEETGEEKKRMINRMRWKGYGPAAIMFNDVEIPNGPPPSVENERQIVNQTLLAKLIERFKERPIWTRSSLFNQFPPSEARDILNSKPLLPLVCYVFQDGPWRDTLVKFQYDPRKEPRARFYQRLYFRNANHPISRPSVVTRRQDRSSTSIQARNLSEHGESEVDKKSSHIFDGKIITKETAAFQLCDISDPMLKSMIQDPDSLRDVCHERDGWYSNHAFERIKAVLRHKFFSLLDGRIATDEECKAILAATEMPGKTAAATRSQKLRTGKHNMAKGALRPEDAAALRLRAVLDRNAKSRLKGTED
ncbi:Transcription factor tau subunit sfc1 [Leucoagaricus sp. SymC.cos]|nr:Transcription factor tau subunit sfc1 [Leucoagaricus sp. SymC.cos]